MAYEFHYTPTGTGVISGKEVLEQTEDAINDLGNTAISGVQEALDKAEQALTNSENAVDDAQTALNTANNAEGVAIQAQNDVSNLSGTVTNIGNRVTTAEGNITNLQGRMTTAEGNIGNLQGRMTTAEGNIGNLQTAVSTAQATANSAQQTATTARQQSYVFRYSSTALTPSSTNSNALLDNTENLKVGDKVIDSSGVLFSVTAIDTANSTFTIGTALIDLAQDSDVVHKSGDETVGGQKTFSNGQIRIKSLSQEIGVTPSSSVIQYLEFADKNDVQHGKVGLGDYDNGASEIQLSISDKYNNGVKDPAGTIDTSFLSFGFQSNGTKFLAFNGRVNNSAIPLVNNTYDLGTSTNKWKSFNGINPGALSLPNGNAQDISWIGDLTVKDGSDYNLKTFTLNGWVTINIPNTVGNLVVVNNGCGQIVTNEANGIAGNNCAVFIPVVANVQVSILLVLQTGESVKTAIFAPCLGNV